jgi:hypothetical protein
MFPDSCPVAPPPPPPHSEHSARLGPNVLTAEYLLAIYSVQANITNTPASDGGTLGDYCFQPMQGQGCVVETPLDYW